MLGSALWLLPPKLSPIEKTLWKLTQDLIPSAFSHVQPFPILYPHITLTSGISDRVTDSEVTNRHEWFRSLPASVQEPPLIRFKSLEIGDRITQKIILPINKEGSLVDLAVQLRATAVEGGNTKAAQSWAAATWTPHVSLLYADADLGHRERSEARVLVEQEGIQLSELGEDFVQAPSTDWRRARILWVDTRGSIADWKVLGEKEITFQENLVSAKD